MNDGNKRAAPMSSADNRNHLLDTAAAYLRETFVGMPQEADAIDELQRAAARLSVERAEFRRDAERLRAELDALRKQEPVAWGITDKHKAVSLTFSKGFAEHWKLDHPNLKTYDFYSAPVPPATLAEVQEVQRSCATCKHAAVDEESYPCRDCTMMARWSAATPAPVAQKVPDVITASELLDAFDAETEKVPVGDESETRGKSTYNWRRAIVREMRTMLAAAQAQGKQP